MRKQFGLILIVLMMVLSGCSTTQHAVVKPLNDYITSQNSCVSQHEQIQTLLEEEAALFIEIVDLGIENTAAIQPGVDDAMNKVNQLQTELESYQACTSQSRDKLEEINSLSPDLINDTQVGLIAQVNQHDEQLNRYIQSLSSLIQVQKSFYEAVLAGQSTTELEAFITKMNEQIESVNETNTHYHDTQSNVNTQYNQVFEQLQDNQ